MVRRLRKVVSALSDEELEVNSPEHPGLDSLVSTLVDPRYLRHKDKEVRLHTVLACMEAFYLYAPEAPWDTNEILSVFEQILQQVGNLSHCTNPSMPNYQNYFRLLDQLATVKVAVVLVELYNQGVNEALETLAELIKTLMEAMHREHPREVMANAVVAITACIEEYDPSSNSIPIAILDEILDVIAAGPTTTEIVAPTSHTTSSSAEDGSNNTKIKKRKSPAQEVPQTIQVPSPAFLLAKHILHRCEDRLSSPIARLLNALLNTHSISPNANAGNGSQSAILQSTRLHTDQVYLIIYELHRVCPDILTEVVGNVAGLLQCEDTSQRLRVTRLLGRLFYSQQSSMLEKFEACFREWIRRASDIDTDIRLVMAKCLVQLVRIGKCSNKNSQDSTRSSIEHALTILLSDKELAIRQHILNTLCNIALEHPSYLTAGLMRQVGERVQSRNKLERREAATGLAKVYARHYMLPRVMSLQHCLPSEEDRDEEEDDTLGEELCTRLHTLLTSHSKDSSSEYEDLLSWIPETILQCLQYYTDEIDWEMRSRLIHLLDEVVIPKSAITSSHQRAVAVCLMYHAVPKGCTRALGELLSNRAVVQDKMVEYIRLRTEATNSSSAEQRQLGMHMAKGVLLNLPHIPYSSNDQDISTKALTRLHTHRDRHLIRLLHTLCTPLHTPGALQRALTDIPSRMNTSDDEVQWIKHAFLRRLGMGHAYTHPTWHSCINLAFQCVRGGVYGIQQGGALVFIEVLDWLTKNVGGGLIGKEGFQVMIQMFGLIHSEYMNFQAVTANSKSSKRGRGRGSNSNAQREADLHTLLHLTAAILSRIAPTFSQMSENGDAYLIEENDQSKMLETLNELCLHGTDPVLARHAVRIIQTLQPAKDNNKVSSGIETLLGKLCTARRLTLPRSDQSTSQILVHLASLTSIAECGLINSRALAFGLKVLLRSDDDKGENLDEDVLCSVIDMVVSYMRCQVQLVKAATKSDKDGNTRNAAIIPELTIQQVKAIYAKLSSLLTLPSSDDDKVMVESMSLLQLTSAKALLRLSDSAMPLPWNKLLTPARYAKLALVLLHQANTVHDPVELWAELKSMLLVKPPYYSLAPKLQFLALCVMCNVNANSNSSSLTGGIRGASRHCILQLRKTVEAVLSQCQSSGEDLFERKFKPALMPEYALPYAVYLLTVTSNMSSMLAASTDAEVHGDDSGNNKVLVKRWKALLEPLVQTLGEEAENVGFLSSVLSEIEYEYSIRNEILQNEHDDDEGLPGITTVSDQQLKFVCRTGRAVLQKYVKKDVNLSAHSKQMVLLPKEFFIRKETFQVNLASTKTTVKDAGVKGRVSFGGTTTVAVSREVKNKDEEFPFPQDDSMDEVVDFEDTHTDFAKTHDDEVNVSSPTPKQQLEPTQDSTTHTNFSASTPAATSTPISRHSSVSHTPSSEISELTAPPSASRTKSKAIDKPNRKNKTGKGSSKTQIVLSRNSIGSSRSGTVSAATGISFSSSSTGTRRSNRKRSSVGSSTASSATSSKKPKSSPLDDFEFSDGEDVSSEDENVGSKRRKGKKKKNSTNNKSKTAISKSQLSTGKSGKTHLRKVDVNVPIRKTKVPEKEGSGTTSTRRKPRATASS